MKLLPMNVGPLNPTVPDLLIGGVLFLLCFWILAGVLLPRIKRTLEEREALTTGRTHEAEAILAEAAEVRSRYEAELAGARHEAARIRQQAKEEGTAAIAAARAEGTRERDALLAAGAERIAEARAAAEAELRPHVDVLAADLAGRILGEPLPAQVGH
ncbi:ATP synthase subunit b [Streptomyces xanthochromogenes]|nr:ATP synthase subunit b [Streptomyces xanthochromogenes]